MARWLLSSTQDLWNKHQIRQKSTQLTKPDEQLHSIKPSHSPGGADGTFGIALDTKVKRSTLFLKTRRPIFELKYLKKSFGFYFWSAKHIHLHIHHSFERFQPGQDFGSSDWRWTRSTWPVNNHKTFGWEIFQHHEKITVEYSLKKFPVICMSSVEATLMNCGTKFVF